MKSLAAFLKQKSAMQNWALIAFVGVNAALLATSMGVAWQNRTFRAEIRAYNISLQPVLGRQAIPLRGLDAEGHPQVVGFGVDRRPLAVYAFSKACLYCEENWSRLRSIQLLAPRDLRFVYLDDLGDTVDEPYRSAHGMAGDTVLVRIDPSDIISYNLGPVPELILVNPAGRIQWFRVGELGSGDIAAVASLVAAAEKSGGRP